MMLGPTFLNLFHEALFRVTPQHIFFFVMLMGMYGVKNTGYKAFLVWKNLRHQIAKKNRTHAPLQHLSFFDEVMTNLPGGNDLMEQAVQWWEHQNNTPWHNPVMTTAAAQSETYTWLTQQRNVLQPSALFQQHLTHMTSWWQQHVNKISADALRSEIQHTKHQLRSTHPDRNGCLAGTRLLIAWKEHLETILPSVLCGWHSADCLPPTTKKSICIEYVMAKTKSDIAAFRNAWQKKHRTQLNHANYVAYVSSAYCRHLRPHKEFKRTPFSHTKIKKAIAQDRHLF